MFEIRKYRPLTQLILLTIAWSWVIVMSILGRNNSIIDSTIEPLSKLIFLMVPLQSMGNSLSAIFLLLLESIYLSYILQKHNLLEQNNWIPSILYLILSGVSGSYELSPPVISNLFILLTIDRLFESYNSAKGIDNIMLASFYVSIATLINFPSIIFIVGIWLSLFVLRNLNWRYFAASFIGMIIPFLYLATWFFINNQLFSEMHAYNEVLRNVFNHTNQKQVGSIILLSASLFFTFISITKLYSTQQGKLIKKRKKVGILLILAIISAASLFISYEPIRKSLITLTLLLSGTISIQISEMKSNIGSSILFWVLIIFFIIANLGIL